MSSLPLPSQREVSRSRHHSEVVGLDAANDRSETVDVRRKLDVLCEPFFLCDPAHNLGRRSRRAYTGREIERGANGY